MSYRVVLFLHELLGFGVHTGARAVAGLCSQQCATVVDPLRLLALVSRGRGRRTFEIRHEQNAATNEWDQTGHY